MANGDDNKTQSSSAVWDRLDQHGSQISELAAGQAATQANLDALARTVDSGFGQINVSLSRVSEELRAQHDRASRPTNWFGAIAALAVVAGGILTFNALQTDPVRVRAIENRASVNSLHERDLSYATEHGRMQAQIELMLRDMYQLKEWQHSANYIHGQREEMGKRLEDIDNQGSRRWNNRTDPREE